MFELPAAYVPAALRRPLLLVLAASLLVACNQKPQVVITSHASPVFTTASSVIIEGAVSGLNTGDIVEAHVNDVPITLQPDGSFSVEVPLDATEVVVPVVAEVVLSGGTVRDRVTFVVADGTTTDIVPDGELSRRAAGLHISKRGFDKIEQEATSILPIDVSSIIPVGTRLVSDQCVLEILWHCTTFLDVDVANPPPSFETVDVDLTPLQGSVRADIAIDGLDLQATAYAKTLFGLVTITCGVAVDLNRVTIDGEYGLSPDAARRRFVDVVQIGEPEASFSGLDFRFTSGLCSIPLIDQVFLLLLPDVQGLFDAGFGDILADPDGPGPLDGPVAAAIESGIAMVEIDGAIGRAIGVNLEAPMDAVLETTEGVTIIADLKVTASMPDPNAFDQPGSFEVSQPFPTFGPTRPSGAPFDVAIAIGASGFNQLLKAEIESGIFLGSVEEIALVPGSDPVPLTVGLLAGFFPELNVLDPATPLAIDIAPTAAPIVLGEPGPNGELATLRIGGLKTVIRTADGSNRTILELESDLPVAIDLEFVEGGVGFDFVTPDAADVNIDVVENPYVVNEFLVASLIPLFLPSLLPELTASLSSFPIPALLGFELGNAEVSMAGEFFAIYGDLE